MLIGSSMEHIIGLVLTEQRLHVLLVADARHQYLGLDVWPLCHHQLYLVLWRLCLVYQHQMPWLVFADLLYDFLSDTAG